MKGPIFHIFILKSPYLRAMASSQMLARRMKRELDLLSCGSAAPGVSAWPRHEGSRFDILDAEICGANDTPYCGGVFRLEINVPSEYPLKPPRVRFLTPIYHPNIDTQGRICLDTLTMPPKGAWKPSLNISTLLTTVQALMSSPNPDDGLMVDITDEYRRNPTLFQRKAREWTQRHAFPSILPASTEPAQLPPPSDASSRKPAEDSKPSSPLLAPEQEVNAKTEPSERSAPSTGPHESNTKVPDGATAERLSSRRGEQDVVLGCLNSNDEIVPVSETPANHSIDQEEEYPSMGRLRKKPRRR